MTIYAVDYYLQYITIIYPFTICQHEHTQLCFSLVESHYMVTSMHEQDGQAVSHP